MKKEGDSTNIVIGKFGLGPASPFSDMGTLRASVILILQHKGVIILFFSHSFVCFIFVILWEC